MEINTEGIEIEIENVVNEHLQQQPYKVSCYVCGGELLVEEKTVDSDADLSVTVEPCKTCIENAVEESGEE